MSPLRFLFLIFTPISSPLSISFAQTASPMEITTKVHFDGINFAPDGYLYMAGSWKGSGVLRCKPDGQVGSYAEGFEGPTDTVMDSKGNVYVSNYNSTYISKIDTERRVTRFGTTPQGPAGLATDSSDNIYVTIWGLPDGDGRSVIRTCSTCWPDAMAASSSPRRPAS